MQLKRTIKVVFVATLVVLLLPRTTTAQEASEQPPEQLEGIGANDAGTDEESSGEDVGEALGDSEGDEAHEILHTQPKVALVLSGGGAKGLAEIPLLEELERQGIVPDIVIGTSMGALVGSLYAAGYTPRQIRQTLLSLDFVSILSENPSNLERIPPEAFSKRTNGISVSFSIQDKKIGSAPGLIGDQMILTELNNHLSRVMPIKDFDRLPIPFRSVGVNVSTGEQIVFSSGSLVDAVRASISIPAVFTPAPVGDGVWAVDGGLRNNLPVKLAREMGADFVIAIDVASVIDTDPTTLSDFYSIGLQLFNLVISSNAVEQYEYADIVLRPDLTEFMMLDFKNPEDIVKAGERCIFENRDQIAELAERIKAAGRDLVYLNPSRDGEYATLEDPVVTDLVIRDVSFSDPCPLPREKEFDVFLGKRFDDKAKADISERLSKLRDRYHLTSLTYYLDSTDEGCTLQIIANHYDQKLSRVFFTGSSTVSITNYKPQEYLSIYTNMTLGVFLHEPVESLLRISLGNTTTVDAAVMPLLTEFKTYALNLEFRNVLKYGSLEPKTNAVFDDRLVDEDRGFEVHAGVRFRNSDFFVARSSLCYFSDKINSTNTWHNASYLHNEIIFTTLHDNFIALYGGKAQVSFDGGGQVTDSNEREGIYSVKFSAEKRFEISEGLNSFGVGMTFKTNRFPWELNSGYSDFGGVEGMCGYPDATFRRDFLITELSLRQYLTQISGMPLYTIFFAKGAVSDGYDPFLEDEGASSRFFADSEAEVGAGAYLALHTPIGNLVAGASFNTDSDWCFTVGLK